MNGNLGISNLDVRFLPKIGKNYVVQDVDRRTERGGILGGVGESSAGKSTVTNRSQIY